MATAAQILELRTRVNDLTDDQGNTLEESQQAFTDTELGYIVDDSYLEASDAVTTADTTSGSTKWDALAMLLARIDAILQIAQDESRRHRWEANNKVGEEQQVAQNLTSVARELRQRYDKAKDRILRATEQGVTHSPTGGVLVFNDTVEKSYNRNFNHAGIQRNTPKYR